MNTAKFIPKSLAKPKYLTNTVNIYKTGFRDSLKRHDTNFFRWERPSVRIADTITWLLEHARGQGLTVREDGLELLDFPTLENAVRDFRARHLKLTFMPPKASLESNAQPNYWWIGLQKKSSRTLDDQAYRRVVNPADVPHIVYHSNSKDWDEIRDRDHSEKTFIRLNPQKLHKAVPLYSSTTINRRDGDKVSEVITTPAPNLPSEMFEAAMRVAVQRFPLILRRPLPEVRTRRRGRKSREKRLYIVTDRAQPCSVKKQILHANTTTVARAAVEALLTDAERCEVKIGWARTDTTSLSLSVYSTSVPLQALTIISTVSSGASVIAMNAYLPSLAEEAPEVVKDPQGSLSLDNSDHGPESAEARAYCVKPLNRHPRLRFPLNPLHHLRTKLSSRISSLGMAASGVERAQEDMRENERDWNLMSEIHVAWIRLVICSGELDILKHIKAQGTANPGANHILSLLDDFEHYGPHGNHVCLVFKPMGPDMSKYRRLFLKPRVPIPVMKKIVKQLLFALAFLHDTCRIIHTDIKPQNILIETPAINEMFEKAPSEAFQLQYSALDPPNDFYSQSEQLSSAEEDLARASDVSVRLADFGTSSWFSKHLTEWIQPQMLRAPEVILGADWDFKTDIWSLGLIIWELAEGALVFDGTWTAPAPYTSEAHLAQMEAVLGNMPESLLVRSKNRDQYFNSQGNLLMPSTFTPLPLEDICRNPDLSVSEQELFLDFIKSMIRLDPKERHDVRSLLDSEWLNQP
ncbi:Serine/threonine-protein kinase SRPK [Leucoagaricus sp. SymC.cos]|nr:Serine/threonine-protein kinase SRPK [Leucoagaricus sp. SymC.cos]